MTLSPPRLDGPAYARGAELAELGAPLGTSRSRVCLAARHPLLTLSYARLVTTLPPLDVTLSTDPGGQYLSRQLGGSWRRAASHVALTLPPTLAEYLRGRSRQAVRTNVRHAHALGLVARQLAVDETASAVRDYERQSDFHAEALGLSDRDTVPYTRWWSVSDDVGHTLALGLVVPDREAALLRVLIGPKDRSVAHQSRYLLHTTLVGDLIADGVRHLLVEAIMGAPAGHKYFAARLGYRPCRVRLHGPVTGLAAPGPTRRNVPVPLDWS